eukprot:TRINITY_DN7698_c0_g1_i1.p1 TRINITY_DN7698_c0_g1~~TRINITY_DN7698_c0_g1_i1.p1  ORF type:complete len:252 (-),score=16.60 TRINITY_DN7698_c0_g1_i1:100-855(-)
MHGNGGAEDDRGPQGRAAAHIPIINPNQSKIHYSPISSVLIYFIATFSIATWTMAMYVPLVRPLGGDGWGWMGIGILFHSFQCSSTPQLLLTLVLLHQLRTVERLIGSLRYLWILILHWTISSSLVLMFTVIPESRWQFVGPQGWIIAMVFLLTRLRPPSFSVQLGGITISDLQFTYLFAFQLVASGSMWTGWIQALCGVVSGILQLKDPVAVFMRPVPAWIVVVDKFVNRNTMKPSSAQISPFISSVAPR